MTADAGPEAPPYLAGGLSEKGRRDSNEDAAILAVLPPPSPLRAFAIVSDGMGGHNAGEVASSLTVEILRGKVQAFAARPDLSTLAPAAIEAEIREWIDEVNREIFQRGKASAEQKGMGATLALALVLADDRLLVANVGDSKIFLVSRLSVRQLSVDHTALAEQRRALGSDSVAPEDDAANPFAHALTRSLGQEKKVVPDVRTDVTLAPGDVVVLTSDGVTDVLEAERFLTALEATGSLQETAEEIHRLAFEAGSKDNISVALLSRGTPARLGLDRTGTRAGPPAPAPPGGGTLVAGAATASPGPAGGGGGSGRRAVLGAAALVVLAALAAVGFFLRRPASPPGPRPAVSPSPPMAASAAPAAALPAATSPAAPSPEAPAASAERPGAATPPPTRGTEAPKHDAPAQTAPRHAPPARGPAEPSFRPPSAFTGLQPLEYPPTPTDTPTPTATPTPSPTATETPTPAVTPPPVHGKPSASPAPQPAATPAVSA